LRSSCCQADDEKAIQNDGCRCGERTVANPEKNYYFSMDHLCEQPQQQQGQGGQHKQDKDNHSEASSSSNSNSDDDNHNRNHINHENKNNNRKRVLLVDVESIGITGTICCLGADFANNRVVTAEVDVGTVTDPARASIIETQEDQNHHPHSIINNAGRRSSGGRGRGSGYCSHAYTTAARNSRFPDNNHDDETTDVVLGVHNSRREEEEDRIAIRGRPPQEEQEQVKRLVLEEDKLQEHAKSCSQHHHHLPPSTNIAFAEHENSNNRSNSNNITPAFGGIRSITSSQVGISLSNSNPRFQTYHYLANRHNHHRAASKTRKSKTPDGCIRKDLLPPSINMPLSSAVESSSVFGGLAAAAADDVAGYAAVNNEQETTNNDKPASASPANRIIQENNTYTSSWDTSTFPGEGLGRAPVTATPLTSISRGKATTTTNTGHPKNCNQTSIDNSDSDMDGDMNGDGDSWPQQQQAQKGNSNSNSENVEHEHDQRPASREAEILMQAALVLQMQGLAMQVSMQALALQMQAWSLQTTAQRAAVAVAVALPEEEEHEQQQPCHIVELEQHQEAVCDAHVQGSTATPIPIIPTKAVCPSMLQMLGASSSRLCCDRNTLHPHQPQQQGRCTHKLEGDCHNNMSTQEEDNNKVVTNNLLPFEDEDNMKNNRNRVVVAGTDTESELGNESASESEAIMAESTATNFEPSPPASERMDNHHSRIAIVPSNSRNSSVRRRQLLSLRDEQSQSQEKYYTNNNSKGEGAMCGANRHSRGTRRSRVLPRVHDMEMESADGADAGGTLLVIDTNNRQSSSSPAVYASAHSPARLTMRASYRERRRNTNTMRGKQLQIREPPPDTDGTAQAPQAKGMWGQQLSESDTNTNGERSTTHTQSDVDCDYKVEAARRTVPASATVSVVSPTSIDRAPTDVVVATEAANTSICSHDQESTHTHPPSSLKESSPSLTRASSSFTPSSTTSSKSDDDIERNNKASTSTNKLILKQRLMKDHSTGTPRHAHAHRMLKHNPVTSKPSKKQEAASPSCQTTRTQARTTVSQRMAMKIASPPRLISALSLSPTDESDTEGALLFETNLNSNHTTKVKEDGSNHPNAASASANPDTCKQVAIMEAQAQTAPCADVAIKDEDGNHHDSSASEGEQQQQTQVSTVVDPQRSANIAVVAPLSSFSRRLALGAFSTRKSVERNQKRTACTVTHNIWSSPETERNCNCNSSVVSPVRLLDQKTKYDQSPPARLLRMASPTSVIAESVEEEEHQQAEEEQEQQPSQPHQSFEIPVIGSDDDEPPSRVVITIPPSPMSQALAVVAAQMQQSSVSVDSGSGSSSSDPQEDRRVRRPGSRSSKYYLANKARERGREPRAVSIPPSPMSRAMAQIHRVNECSGASTTTGRQRRNDAEPAKQEDHDEPNSKKCFKTPLPTSPMRSQAMPQALAMAHVHSHPDEADVMSQDQDTTSSKKSHTSTTCFTTPPRKSQTTQTRSLRMVSPKVREQAAVTKAASSPRRLQAAVASCKKPLTLTSGISIRPNVREKALTRVTPSRLAQADPPKPSNSSPNVRESTTNAMTPPRWPQQSDPKPSKESGMDADEDEDESSRVLVKQWLHSKCSYIQPHDLQEYASTLFQLGFDCLEVLNSDGALQPNDLEFMKVAHRRALSKALNFQ
jgi:hypothetical protein